MKKSGILSIFGVLLISFVFSASTGTDQLEPVEKKNQFINPKCTVYYVNSLDIPEGGFFDPASEDLANAFDFVLSANSRYNSYTPYRISSRRLGVTATQIDFDVLDNCILIESHWESKGLTQEEIKPLVGSILGRPQRFKYLAFNAKTNKWVETERSSKMMKYLPMNLNVKTPLEGTGRSQSISIKKGKRKRIKSWSPKAIPKLFHYPVLINQN